MRQLLLFSLFCAFHTSSAISVTMNTFNDACGNGTGRVHAIVSGGQGPYTFVWSPNPPVGQGTNTARELVAGTYTVTVTDALGDEVIGSSTVLAIPTLIPGNLNSGSVTSCDGACNGAGSVSTNSIPWGGVPPYTTSVAPGGTGTTGSGHVYLSGLCPGTTYTCTVTDANGCASIISNIQVMDLNTPVLLDVQVTPSCAGGTTGSAVLTFDQVGEAGSLSQWGMWTSYPSDGTQVFMSNLGPGDHWVEAFPLDPTGNWGGPPQMGNCGLGTLVIIPLSTDPCGQVEGTVYVDLNSDCVHDASDVPYPWRVVRCEPGGHYALTDNTGYYREELSYGAYTAGIADLGEHGPLCPAALPAPFALNAITPNVTLDMAVEALYGADMEALLVSGTPRPGFPFSYALRTLNNGAFPFGPYTVTLTYDPALTYNSSSLVPAVNAPGLLQFNVPLLSSFGQSNINVVLQVPPNPALIGTYLDATLTVSPAPADIDPANDTDALSTLVVGAYDPNDKLVFTSTRSSNTQYFLDVDTALDYTIRFQNTGNAEALHVRLVDTLAPTLDVGSLRLRGATHAFEARLESDSILIIDFPDIMLPDSTSDLIGSQGSFSFSIRPRAGSLPGTAISNKADIYFDFNPPIRTNTATVVTEISTPVGTIPIFMPLTLAPNPVESQLRVALQGSGTGNWMIHDVQGRVAMSGNWNGTSMTIPMETLRTGIYTITVFTVTGRSIARFAKE